MAPAASKADRKAALDTASWLFNVVTSVGIIMVNKALMATHGFTFGNEQEKQNDGEENSSAHPAKDLLGLDGNSQLYGEYFRVRRASVTRVSEKESSKFLGESKLENSSFTSIPHCTAGIPLMVPETLTRLFGISPVYLRSTVVRD